MIADDAPAREATEDNEAAAGPAPSESEATTSKPAAPTPKAAEESAGAEEPEPERPAPDPVACRAMAIGLTALWESVLQGEWDGTEFEYYLEPAGVTQARLSCTRAPENAPELAGLLMTRAGWQARTVFLDDGVNPETYELGFPKEFGYVKPLSHYRPESRENARYPWSKKY